MRNNRTRRDVKVINNAAYILLTRGKRAIIDLADFDRVANFSWTVHQSSTQKKPYVKACISKVGGKQTFALLHRFVLDAAPGTIVDHINGNPLDNRRSNLRLVTPAENVFNRRAYGESGFKGVYKNHKRFMVKIRHPGSAKETYYGTFATAEEAAAVYDKIAPTIFGDFAVLNKVAPK